MACAGCSITKSGSDAKGCGGGCSSGGCSTGGCNRLNTFDWLTNLDIEDTEPFQYVEVSFKNGARKAFFRNPETSRVTTGDWVLVEAVNGYDIGRISLSGDLVRLQMKKKRINIDHILHSVIRKANERDLERMQESRAREKETIVLARAIARTLRINMKVGDVEYQGDGRKATFFYTADGRVDFRELIRQYAREFHVKIEMRQIGARQESARIGGIGSCGRELCCSTWLSDFKSVNTSAARYQNLAINQSKLSGQCGRLKCCLNYELDTYLDALQGFPEDAEKLQTKEGVAVLVKTDIFKQLMYYAYEHEGNRGKLYALDARQVHSIVAMNKAGDRPSGLVEMQVAQPARDENEPEVDYSDVTGAIELPEEERRRRKKKKKRGKGTTGAGAGPGNSPGEPNQPRGNNDPNRQRKPADPNQPRGNNDPNRQRKPVDPNQPRKPGGPNPGGEGGPPPRSGNRPPKRRDRPDDGGNRDRKPPQDENKQP